ncbi:NADP-dependent oxidoreductase [Streptomyces hainanensis]|uniref:NADP-dependent oxidoreductase n=1 Tax=Streptomyces hainanensis TaxID=402648 RepID=A0A4R4TEG6_9ACTN|nr:NADP-dependent oxidoreductase [Streptomyces hainanensis]TDC75787.1 NADP-dependent oxidoreductase [Streptomyces hainanensis]
MRAVLITRYGPADTMRVGEVEAPHAGPREIRIRVVASGLTPADTYLRAGRLRESIALRLPHVTGVDAAGVVDEVGAGVTGVAPGDAVFGLTDPARLGGAHAEHAVLVAWAAKPTAWSWDEAGGAAGNVETATRVLDRLGVGAGAGRTVLVHGAAGGVGTVAVQLAAARGATVVGTASEGNHDLLRSLGAAPTTYGPGLAERVGALAPGGVDAVLDCAGGTLPELIGIAGDAARVVTIADLDAAAHGVHLSHSAPVTEMDGAAVGDADPMAVHGLRAAAALAAEGRLRVPVAATFPLAEAAAAHELSESRHARGKIVLRAGPDA